MKKKKEKKLALCGMSVCQGSTNLIFQIGKASTSPHSGLYISHKELNVGVLQVHLVDNRLVNLKFLPLVHKVHLVVDEK